jgi:hypothetical protein
MADSLLLASDEDDHRLDATKDQRMRTTASLLLASSFSLVVACQGRIEPDYSLLEEQEAEVEAEQPETEDEVVLACVGNNACLADRLGDRVTVETAPNHKNPEDIRDGLIHGGQPGVATPAPAPSALLEGTCAGDLFTQTGMDNPGIELHVLSIGDAGEDAEVRVFVERQEAVALVLSSYASTTWIVDFAPGARITEIVLNGEGDQHVQTADHIAVTKLIGEQSLGGFGVGGQDDKERQATATLIQGAESVTGLRLKSFAGCAQGTAFSIGGE